jgi:hypothetical protein
MLEYALRTAGLQLEPCERHIIYPSHPNQLSLSAPHFGAFVRSLAYSNWLPSPGCMAHLSYRLPISTWPIPKKSFALSGSKAG